MILRYNTTVCEAVESGGDRHLSAYFEGGPVPRVWEQQHILKTKRKEADESEVCASESRHPVGCVGLRECSTIA